MPKTKTAPASPKTAASPEAGNGIPDFRAVFETNGAAFAAAVKASEAMLQGLAEMNREMMSFASERFRKSFETSESLLGCHDPAQAFSVQCDHAHKATQAYLEEATRLMSLAAKVSEECLQPIESQARETLDQIGKAKQASAD